MLVVVELVKSLLVFFQLLSLVQLVRPLVVHHSHRRHEVAVKFEVDRLVTIPRKLFIHYLLDLELV